MALAVSEWFDEEGLFSPEERNERRAWRHRRMLHFSECGKRIRAEGALLTPGACCSDVPDTTHAATAPAIVRTLFQDDDQQAEGHHQADVHWLEDEPPCELLGSFREIKEAASSAELLPSTTRKLKDAHRGLTTVTAFGGIFLAYHWHIRQCKRKRQNGATADSLAQSWHEQHAWAGPRIASALTKLGGLYVKVGQDLAARAYVLPPEWLPHLHSLWDEVAPRAWHEMEPILKHELHDLRQCTQPRDAPGIRSVDEKPLASASIGQVHRAELTNGEQVVIKLIYPDVRHTLHQDIRNMRAVVAKARTYIEKAGQPIDIDTPLNELFSTLPSELDFRKELNNLTRVQSNLTKAGYNGKVVLPSTFPHLCTSGMLVMQELHGCFFSALLDGRTSSPNARRSKEQHHRRQDAYRERYARQVIPERANVINAFDVLVDVLGHMIFVDGFFHADPHPGNILLCSNGSLGMIDFGQCKSLSPDDRAQLCALVLVMSSGSDLLATVGLQSLSLQIDGAGETQLAIADLFFDSVGAGTLATLGYEANQLHAVSDEHIATLNNKTGKDFAVLRDLHKTWHSSPKDVNKIRNVPNCFVYYGRVLNQLRKVCEVLEYEVSVVQRWQPLCRTVLHDLVRDPSNSLKNRDVLQGLLCIPSAKSLGGTSFDATVARWRESPEAMQGLLQIMCAMDSPTRSECIKLLASTSHEPINQLQLLTKVLVRVLAASSHCLNLFRVASERAAHFQLANEANREGGALFGWSWRENSSILSSALQSLSMAMLDLFAIAWSWLQEQLKGLNSHLQKPWPRFANCLQPKQQKPGNHSLPDTRRNGSNLHGQHQLSAWLSSVGVCAFILLLSRFLCCN